MRVSASIELIWNIAAQEAIATEFAEIQPEHFLEAIMKFAEIPLEEVTKMAPSESVARELTLEIGTVQHELKARSVDSTQARRQLRTRLGSGKCPYTGGQLHRSQTARDMFDAAGRLADDLGSEALVAMHLLAAILESPSQAMCDVLGGGSLGLKPPKAAQTPLLDRFGRDLAQVPTNGHLPTATADNAECKALVRLLADPSRRSVLLVTDCAEAARGVAVAVARLLAAPERPANLRGKRLVDVAHLAGGQPPSGEVLEQLDQLLAEAATLPDVALFVPPITGCGEAATDEPWITILGKTMAGGTAQCICAISPAAYEQRLRKDVAWRDHSQVMWVGETAQGEVPWEL